MLIECRIGSRDKTQFKPTECQRGEQDRTFYTVDWAPCSLGLLCSQWLAQFVIRQRERNCSEALRRVLDYWIIHEWDFFSHSHRLMKHFIHIQWLRLSPAYIWWCSSFALPVFQLQGIKFMIYTWMWMSRFQTCYFSKGSNHSLQTAGFFSVDSPDKFLYIYIYIFYS